LTGNDEYISLSTWFLLLVLLQSRIEFKNPFTSNLDVTTSYPLDQLGNMNGFSF
jgi:hypothetical protein